MRAVTSSTSITSRIVRAPAATVMSHDGRRSTLIPSLVSRDCQVIASRRLCCLGLTSVGASPTLHAARNAARTAPRRTSESTAHWRVRMFRTFMCMAFAALFIVTPQAQTGTTIVVWKVGSPHTGNVPHAEVPPALAREAASRGWRLRTEAFPAEAFADLFGAASRMGRSGRRGVRTSAS